MATKRGSSPKTPKKPAKVGRPTDYNDKISTLICSRLAEGEPLTKMCKEPDMPNVVTVYRWMDAHPEFSKAYARAREDQADTLAAEIIEIADDGSRDYAVNEDGREVVDHDHIQRSRLRVDTRKWYASKLAPKRYSERMELTGESGTALIPQIDDMELARRIAFGLLKASRAIDAASDGSPN